MVFILKDTKNNNGQTKIFEFVKLKFYDATTKKVIRNIDYKEYYY